MNRRRAKLVGLERVCHVATVGSSGVPVCHVLHNGKLYFASGGDARRVSNLRANPHVAVTVDCYAEDWSNLKGVMIQGRATLLERGARFTSARRLLYQKYPQAPLARGDVIVEVTPRHVFSWGLD